MGQKQERDRLVSAAEAARRLGVGMTTLAKVASAGHLEKVRIPGVAAVRFRQSDVDALVGTSALTDDELYRRYLAGLAKSHGPNAIGAAELLERLDRAGGDPPC